MKRIFLSIIFLVFAFLMITPLSHKAAAAVCNLLPLNLGIGCACSLNIQCSTGYCHWPIQTPPLPIGYCSLPPGPSDDEIGAVSPLSLTAIRYPIPEAPCVNYTNGVCTLVNTALGNIDTEPGKFISRLFGIMLAVSGSIALILIMRSGYSIMTARGNPEGIQKGRERLVAAIIGLMFLVLSFVLLQVISVDLLKIPGISGSPNSEVHTCSDANGTCRNAVSCANDGGTILGQLGCTGSAEIVCCVPKVKTCQDWNGSCTPRGVCIAEAGATTHNTPDCTAVGSSFTCCVVPNSGGTPTGGGSTGGGGTGGGGTGGGGTGGGGTGGGGTGGGGTGGGGTGGGGSTSPNPVCKGIGGFCFASGACRAEGGTTSGRQDCNSDQICCTGL